MSQSFVGTGPQTLNAGSMAAASPPQFDASLQLATMEAVQRALGATSGVTQINATTTLALANIGNLVVFFGTAASQTINLPPLAGVKIGAGFWIQNVASAAVTIKANASEQITTTTLGVGVTSANTLILAPGDSVFIVALGGSWIEQQSSRAASAGGASLISFNGWQKLPSGLIIQWGSTVAATASDIATTLPIAYPNNFWHVFVLQSYTPGSASIGYAAGNPTSLSAFTWRGSTSGNGHRFFAIGY